MNNARECARNPKIFLLSITNESAWHKSGTMKKIEKENPSQSYDLRLGVQR
jgi:hypothetical protein